jgi:hypothetical protein
MVAKRVLFLGQTGVSKKEALGNLATYCKKRYDRDCNVIDFDRDFLCGRVPQNAFLDANFRTQRREWLDAWDECFQKAIGPLMKKERDIFLGLHGCYTRSQYGSRCVIDLKKVAQFQPTLVVTLIADVYDMWWRTESRAKGEAWRGMPTLEHLIAGRRSEVMVADLIALECTERIDSLVIAASHPCDTVAKCIFGTDPRLVYLSFPISEPRRQEEKGDLSGIEAVSNLIRLAHEKQKSDTDLAFICPLAIDELPLSLKLPPPDDKETEETPFTFERDKLRWDLARLWPLDERMTKPAVPHGPFRIQDIRKAAGSIYTDVGWRDFRLAEQADKLAVFNPIFPGRQTATRGVANEVTFATAMGRPTYVYQDPALDPENLCDKVWLTGYGAGTMGQSPSAKNIKREKTIEELLKSL